MPGDTGNLGNGNQNRTDRNCPASPQHLIAASELEGDRLWLKKLRQVIIDCKIKSKELGWRCIRFPPRLMEMEKVWLCLVCLIAPRGKRKQKGGGRGGGNKGPGFGFSPPASIH